MAARVLKRESMTDPRPRLRQLGAKIQRAKSTAQRTVYYSRAHEIWLSVTAHRAGYTLTYYDACPCSG